MTISVDVNDSPKLYFHFKDIYGDDFAPEFSELDSLTYTVYRILDGQKVPVEDFVDVPIPGHCWRTPPAPFPDAIKGVSDDTINEGYTLELFPYRVGDDGVLVSPFRWDRTRYLVVVTLEYFLDDAAIDAALYRRELAVRVVTGANK
jgi:hypothetical protein